MLVSSLTIKPFVKLEWKPIVLFRLVTMHRILDN
jgi:hypothetical protein